jgi:hypothetical protein
MLIFSNNNNYFNDYLERTFIPTITEKSVMDKNFTLFTSIVHSTKPEYDFLNYFYIIKCFLV